MSRPEPDADIRILPRIGRLIRLLTTRVPLVLSAVAYLVVVAGASSEGKSASTQILTRAEATGFRETSRLIDVERFLHQLQRLSDRILLTQIGTSTEGRPIWMMILGDPPPASPAEAHALEKPVIYVEANIHAGEVEGKEVLQMLARDILLGDLQELLRDQILLFVPVLNPDGNEKIGPGNRRNQAGPEGGVGVRHNGQGLDLNRDFVKLETPEIRAVVGVLNRWDPILFVDIHTTNGSKHRHTVTYAVPHNPNGDPAIDRYLRTHLMAWVGKEMAERFDNPIIPYGNFRKRGQPDSGWVTYSPLARYGTNYVGLRNRFSILVENYAYAPFERRVRGCYQFMLSLLRFTNEHGREMQKLVRNADERTRNSVAGSKLGVAFRIAAFPDPIRILSYRFAPDTLEDRRVRWVPTTEPREYVVPYFGRFEPTQFAMIPEAYAFPPVYREAAETLARHGINVLALRDTLRVRAERNRFVEVKVANLPFQGHWLTKATCEPDTVSISLPPGSYLVPTRQPLGYLVAWLLEPQSPDGLLTWNFFDRSIRASEWSARLGTYPVLKIYEPVRAAAVMLDPNR